jgi:hypothetical protein
MEGTYYPAVIMEIYYIDEIKWYSVKYDDDDSYENVSHDNIRSILLPTVTQTALGGPLTDQEAFNMTGLQHSADDYVIFENYELHEELAHLKEEVFDLVSAVKYYDLASEEAMAAGKMKLASKWSCQSLELRSNL